MSFVKKKDAPSSGRWAGRRRKGRGGIEDKRDPQKYSLPSTSKGKDQQQSRKKVSRN